VSLHSIGEKGDDFEVPLVFLHGLLGSSNNFRSVVLIRDHDPPFERTALFSYACSFCLPGYEVRCYVLACSSSLPTAFIDTASHQASENGHYETTNHWLPVAHACIVL
jgi:pimeloyl-ACP methyl ester carboxylesterase